MIAERELPKLASNGSNYLYTTEYNYVDFSVDDNGLWAIYTTADSNNTIVAKVSKHVRNVIHWMSKKEMGGWGMTLFLPLGDEHD